MSDEKIEGITVDNQTDIVKRIVAEGEHGKVTITVSVDEGFPVIEIHAEPDAEHHPYLCVDNPATGNDSFHLELRENQPFYLSFIQK